MFKITKKHLWLYIMGCNETLEYYNPLIVETIMYNIAIHRLSALEWYNRYNENIEII